MTGLQYRTGFTYTENKCVEVRNQRKPHYQCMYSSIVQKLHSTKWRPYRIIFNCTAAAAQHHVNSRLVHWAVYPHTRQGGRTRMAKPGMTTRYERNAGSWSNHAHVAAIRRRPTCGTRPLRGVVLSSAMWLMSPKFVRSRQAGNQA